MLCDRCQKRPANIYLSKIVNGQKTELRLCQECAAEMGETALPGFPLPQFNFNSLLAGLFNQASPG
ncbi:MAG: hypothetical protein QJR13_01880, partial [Bacillota bacterium]|nr:hypothetical protein [Bacillota bacterium]